MATYNLTLDQPRDNVFVTQLNQQQAHGEERPLLSRPVGQLIEESLTHEQQTRRLRRAVESEATARQLDAKRVEFERRMTACAHTRADVRLRQQRMRDRVLKFDKFINENEVKRRRAVQKYQLEVRLREQKRQEHTASEAQLTQLRTRHDVFKKKLAGSRKYEDYLLRVLDTLPEHYLEVTDTQLNSLMMRHRTLSDTNATLVENVNAIVDDLEQLKQHLKGLEADHERMKLDINSQLASKQHQHERTQSENHGVEEHLVRQKLMSRKQAVDYGQILMAIDNLADKSRRYVDPPVETMKLRTRLQTIEDYITHQMAIIIMAVEAGSTSPCSPRR